eukprot:365810-Chlamydomonas_euryale.AAC.6
MKSGTPALAMAAPGREHDQRQSTEECSASQLRNAAPLTLPERWIRCLHARLPTCAEVIASAAAARARAGKYARAHVLCQRGLARLTPCTHAATHYAAQKTDPGMRACREHSLRLPIR